MTAILRNPEVPAGFIRASELAELGFTPYSLWRLLGNPAISLTDLPFPKRLGDHLYDSNQARQAASTKEFQLMRLRELLRERRVGLQKRAEMEETLRWAANAEIKTKFPNMTLTEIMELACADRSNWDWPNGMPAELQRPTPETKAVWAYTYLKHNCTNYDDLCSQLEGRPFARYGQPAILHRVNRVILDRFPGLPVRAGTGGPLRTCKGCGQTAKGNHNGYYWTTPEGWHARAKPHKNHTIHEFCSLKCAGQYAQGHPTANQSAKMTTGKREE